MPQNHRPGINVFKSLLYFLSNVVAHTANPSMSKHIDSAAGNDFFASLRLGPFGSDNYAKVSTTFLPSPDAFTDFINVKGPLRNQDCVCASSDPCLQGDPTSISAHNFQYYHSVMGFCCCMKPIECFTSNRYRRLETKGIVRSNKVVVDRFGNSNDGQPHFKQSVGYAKRVLSTYCNYCSNAVFGNVF